ncbi:hypothetical protein Tco_1275099 [Tanacetum coccineum]
MNELVNDGIKLLKLEINTGFINGLPKKWLSFYQSLININHVKESELASLFDNPNDEEDIRSSQEYMDDHEEEYQTRALLTKSKRFFKKGTQRFSGAKATDQTECHKCGRKGHFARDKEEVSSDDNEIVEVKVLMTLVDDNAAVSKEGARNGEWVKISMRKVHTLLEMEDNDEIMNLLDYLCIDLIYAEEQRNNLLSKHKDLVGIKSLHDDLRVTAAQMDQDSAHMVAALKVSMLKPENGNAPQVRKVVEGVETTIAPAIAEEKTQRRLELKARSTLLMRIPNEHQLKFNSIKEQSLESVEARLLVYKKNEFVYEEDIKSIVDKCKIGLGYNAVPPPYIGNFMPPKPDLSFSSLEEFVNEPIVSEATVKKHVVETSEAKSSADKPKVSRKNNGALIIEEWVFDNEE